VVRSTAALQRPGAQFLTHTHADTHTHTHTHARRHTHARTHTHGLQLSITPFRGDLVFLTFRHQTRMWCTDIHPGKIVH